MTGTPPINPAAVFPNTAVAPFAPVGRGNPGTAPAERPTGTSFPPLDQPETTQGSQLNPRRPDAAGGSKTETSAEQVEIRELKQRDQAVRAHERAHQSAGGQYVSAAQLRYTRGADGRLYASEGEVTINAAPIPGDAEATLIKAGIVRRAALAPVDPSAADLRVAAEAARIQARARSELQQQRSEDPDDGERTRDFSIQASFLQRLVELGVIDAPRQIRPGAVLDTLA